MATPPRPDLRRRWQRRIIALRRVVLHRQVLLYVLAAVVGLIAAYAALGFRLAIGLVQTLAYGNADERLAHHAAALSWAHVLLAPCIGGLFVGLLLELAPGGASAHGLYAMVGMGAVAAAVLGAPISTTLIAFELTGDYRGTAALMLAVSMAVLLVQNMLGRSFFQWQLERQGLDLQFGLARLSLRQLTVGEVMRTDFARLDADAAWDEVMRHLPAPQTTAPGEAFVVTDAEGALVGVARYVDLAALAVDPMRPEHLRARHLARPVEPLVQTETVERALEALARTGEPFLPVVAAGRTRQVLGILPYRDVLETTHRAILAADEEEHGR